MDENGANSADSVHFVLGTHAQKRCSGRVTARRDLAPRCLGARHLTKDTDCLLDHRVMAACGRGDAGRLSLLHS